MLLLFCIKVEYFVLAFKEKVIALKIDKARNLIEVHPSLIWSLQLLSQIQKADEDEKKPNNILEAFLTETPDTPI